jgi:hypothetical protein
MHRVLFSVLFKGTNLAPFFVIVVLLANLKKTVNSLARPLHEMPVPVDTYCELMVR